LQAREIGRQDSGGVLPEALGRGCHLRAHVGLGFSRGQALAQGEPLQQRGQFVAQTLELGGQEEVVEHESGIVLDHSQPLARPVRCRVDDPQCPNPLLRHEDGAACRPGGCRGVHRRARRTEGRGPRAGRIDPRTSGGANAMRRGGDLRWLREVQWLAGTGRRLFRAGPAQAAYLLLDGLGTNPTLSQPPADFFMPSCQRQQHVLCGQLHCLESAENRSRDLGQGRIDLRRKPPNGGPPGKITIPATSGTLPREETIGRPLQGGPPALHRVRVDAVLRQRNCRPTLAFRQQAEKQCRCFQDFGGLAGGPGGGLGQGPLHCRSERQRHVLHPGTTRPPPQAHEGEALMIVTYGAASSCLDSARVESYNSEAAGRNGRGSLRAKASRHGQDAVGDISLARTSSIVEAG